MPYDLGDTVPLSVTVRDAAGEPTTAGTCVLSVELPDGTTVQPPVNNDTTGVYTVAYVPTVPGRHVLRWASTDPATAYADIVDVRSAAPTIISLADAKRYLRGSLTASDDDEQLRSFLEVVTAVVEDVSGQAIVRRSVTEQHSVYDPTSVPLFVTPVVSLTSITDVDGQTTYDVANYRVDPESGWVTPRAGAVALRGHVEITYEVGMRVPPARYVQAALVTLRHLWESQRVPVGGRQVGAAAAIDREVTVSGWSVPAAAVDLIGPRAVEVG